MSSQALITNPILPPTKLLTSLQSGQKLKVRGTRGSVLILCHRHHAEILGNGAAVGGMLDLDCRRVIPLGEISLIYPESFQERKRAYFIRQKWIRSTQKVLARPAPLQRATIILRMLEDYCGSRSIEQLSDEIIAQLIGVLPSTIATARHVRKQRTSHQSTVPKTTLASPFS